MPAIATNLMQLFGHASCSLQREVKSERVNERDQLGRGDLASASTSVTTRLFG
jgi:hypothetical protein